MRRWLLRIGLGSLAMTAAAAAAPAAEIISEYTDLDTTKSCNLLKSDAESASATLVCPGWRGFPVLVDTGDLRDSVFYGFPPAGDLPWESFSPFNAAGPKIEWRIVRDGETATPFATIHRFSVSADPEDPERKTEVLVVEKVGQPGTGDGCAVGLVLATGNAKANETARRIADEQARDFACGADERVLVGGDESLPEFDRQQ